MTYAYNVNVTLRTPPGLLALKAGTIWHDHSKNGQGKERKVSERKLSRPLGLYFEEFTVADTVESVGRTITETDVVNFAGISGDWNLIHTNAEFSAQGMFGQRVAHGLLILSIASGLAVRLGFMEETILAFRGLNWKFAKPIFIGDTVRLRVTVAETRAMKRAGGGLVTFKMEVLNQTDEVCQRGEWEILCASRETIPAETE